MKTKPLLFNLLAIYLLAVAVNVPVQLMWLYDYKLTDWYLFGEQMTFLNWLVLLGLMASGLSLYWTHQQSIKILAITTAIVWINNLLVGYVAADYSMTESCLAAFAFTLPLSLLLVPKYQKVLLERRLQWWKTPERINKEIVLQIVAESSEQLAIKAKTINISSSGALLEFDSYFAMGNDAAITLYLYNNNKISCQARVVREQKVEQPGLRRVGVQFVGLGEASTREFLRGLYAHKQAQRAQF